MHNGRDAKVEAIHAGLECGFFSSKIPGLDCVSFGPDLRDIHTCNESVGTASVGRMYDLIKATLARL
ncbi:MAG: hypothetical protein KBT31_00045 [Firmicutes bacterium]|nr:hypothetical protein [Candidatus Colimorpha enterica]